MGWIDNIVIYIYRTALKIRLFLTKNEQWNGSVGVKLEGFDRVSRHKVSFGP